MKATNTSRKSLIALILIVLCITFILPMLTPTAHAFDANRHNGETNKQYYERIKNDLPSICHFAWFFATASYGVNPDYDIAAIAEGILKFPNIEFTGFGQDGSKATIASIGKITYQVFAVIGSVLVLLYFLIEILDEVQADNFNFEHLIKKLITVAVALLAIAYGRDILEKLMHIGDILVDVAKDSGEAGLGANTKLAAIAQSLYDAGHSGGMFSTIVALGESIAVFLQNIIQSLLFMIAFLIVGLTAYSRFIEVLVRFMFAPVGMAPLVSGGSKSAGMRYLKKFASVCIQGAVCMGAIYAAYAVMGAGDVVQQGLGLFLVPLCLIGFMLKSGRIADDIIGV